MGTASVRLAYQPLFGKVGRERNGEERGPNSRDQQKSSLNFSLSDYKHNRIYNKILDRDWFSARLFVTKSARDHVGVQLQVSDLNFL